MVVTKMHGLKFHQNHVDTHELVLMVNLEEKNHAVCNLKVHS